MRTYALTGLALYVGSAIGCASSADDHVRTVTSADTLDGDRMLAPLDDGSGRVQSATPTDSIDLTNPFFQSLGTNGRTCNSCHRAEDGWTITPASLQARFDATGGADPVFFTLDGADSPTAPHGTIDERRAASGNLLSRGTIRVGLPAVRATATWDITIEILADPKNSDALFPTNGQVSFFRRPLPTTNLRFTAAINWDGRNTPDLTNMHPGLLAQSNGATVLHAQGAPLDAATREAIVDFETSLVTAQVKDDVAGTLHAAGALGGPAALLTQPFAIGMNSGASFDPDNFDIYDAWHAVGGARGDVEAGQHVFYGKAFGPNDSRTCSSCHNAPDVGSSTTFVFFDDGVSAASRWNGSVPLYRVHQKSNPSNYVDTTDPGRAMITGRFADVNAFKVPGLRGLAARPPYFHDGSAATLEDVVDHYEQRFGIVFQDREKAQLVQFLKSL